MNGLLCSPCRGLVSLVLASPRSSSRPVITAKVLLHLQRYLRLCSRHNPFPFEARLQISFILVDLVSFSVPMKRATPPSRLGNCKGRLRHSHQSSQYLHLQDIVSIATSSVDQERSREAAKWAWSLGQLTCRIIIDDCLLEFVFDKARRVMMVMN